VTFTPAGNVASTDVQAAIQEVDSEKVAKAGDTMTGALSLPPGISSAPGLNFGTVDTGIYGGSTVKIAVAGNNRLSITGTNVSAFVPVSLPADPTNPLDAATKQYVDGAVTTRVAKAGDTMTGQLTLQNASSGNLYLVATSPYVGFCPNTTPGTRVGYIQSVNGGAFTINGESANINMLTATVYIGPRTTNVVAIRWPRVRLGLRPRSVSASRHPR
jgi:hypothetical protein